MASGYSYAARRHKSKMLLACAALSNFASRYVQSYLRQRLCIRWYVYLRVVRNVCIYRYVCVYIYICTCLKCRHIRVCVYIYICTFKFTHTSSRYTHTCRCICICVYVRICMCIYREMSICVYNSQATYFFRCACLAVLLALFVVFSVCKSWLCNRGNPAES